VRIIEKVKIEYKTLMVYAFFNYHGHQKQVKVVARSVCRLCLSQT